MSDAEMVLIDGEEYPREVDGMVLVDVFYIMKEDVEAYTADREHYAQKALQFFATFCPYPERDWAGTEDGEAVLGLNYNGEIRAMVYLDPDGIDGMKEADDEDEFEAHLLEINEITPAQFERFQQEVIERGN